MQTLPASEVWRAVGKYVIGYFRVRLVMRIERVDRKGNSVLFTQIGGREDGKQFVSAYDEKAEDVEVYDENEVALALLRT